MTATNLKYASIERLPQPDGREADRQFSRMMAHLTARYQLTAVRGRPEELISPRTEEGGLSRGVSLGYGSRTIRVRLMAGRDWIRTEDFQLSPLKADWVSQLNEMCDVYFGYTGPGTTDKRHWMGPADDTSTPRRTTGGKATSIPPRPAEPYEDKK